MCAATDDNFATSPHKIVELRTPEAFLDLEVKRNGGLENPDVRNIRQLLRRAADS
ncbi:hypothetical protein [Glaciibacter superstes]|uniref:hypothetical protein n=1 Tax=Glaciibacter superstes TaxID=501023 RepID=UPI0003B30F58|nr:hypothetical protein [Glaciibacter superstes]